jgi:ABC-2 type transport system ATP-binding protein
MSLKVTNVTKKYGEQKALNEVSFEIQTGEIIGFLGPNGAGKSTMMKIITGFIPQNSGEVYVNGMNIDTDAKEIKKLIGYLPEHNPLYHDMYIREYLNFVAKLYKIPNKNIKSKVDDIIQITGLEIEQNKKTGALSKGYKQRTGLAAALIHDPNVLILDEPTTGLDPNQIIEIRNLIAQVGKEKTVMLSTHIMQEVEAVCNRVIIINKGEIVADEPVEQIKRLSGERMNSVYVEFNTAPSSDLFKHIQNLKEFVKINDTQYNFEAASESDIRPAIFEFAVKNHLVILTMQRKEKSIEDVFRSLTK